MAGSLALILNLRQRWRDAPDEAEAALDAAEHLNPRYTGPEVAIAKQQMQWIHRMEGQLRDAVSNSDFDSMKALLEECQTYEAVEGLGANRYESTMTTRCQSELSSNREKNADFPVPESP